MATQEEGNAAATLEEIELNTDLPTTTSACGITVPVAAEAITTTTATRSALATTITDNNVIGAADGIIDLCNANSPTPSTSKSVGAVTATSTSVISLDDSVEEEEEQSSSVAENTSASSTAAAVGSSTTIECPICLQTCIHPARLPCGHIFCFLCVKGVAYKNRRCAMCRREIPPEFLDHPDLVNGIEDISVTKSTEDGYQWFYEGRNGWWQYDDRTSQDIEEAFKKGEKSCIILVAGYVYVVDLEAMVQQRQNEPVRCRRVKRDLATIPKKGVAGLRIEGNTVITDSNFASQVQQQQQQRNIIIGISAANTPLDPTSDFSPPLNFYSLRHPTNASDFITTIAATDAAIRIASDIIGSTLAHADELSRSGSGFGATLTGQQNNSGDAQQQQMFDEMTGTYSGPYRPLLGTQSAAGSSTSSTQRNGSGGSVPNSSAAIAAHARVAHGSRELLDAAEDLLDATQNVISEADQQTIDLFEQTLNDFHALTLRNIIDSDSSDGEENRNGNGGGGGGVGVGVGISGGSGVGGDDDVDDDSYAPRHIRF